MGQYRDALKRWIPFGLLSLSLFGLGPASAEIRLSPKLATALEVTEGDVLLRELNCASCHSGKDLGLPMRPGPVLGEGGLKLTPQFIREWLKSPHQTKPGTAMPELLHSMPADKRAETIDALTHYLLSVQDQTEKPGLAPEDYHLKSGETLFHTVGCVACHAPTSAPASLPGIAFEEGNSRKAPDLTNASIPLGPLPSKTTADELARFLRDPVKMRPSGRMPSLSLTDDEATSLAVWLLRDQLPSSENPGEVKQVQGLKYHYYEGGVNRTDQLTALTPKKSGVATKFDATLRQRENNFGFRFTGSIRIEKPGEYTFSVLSDDGTRLWLGDKLVVDNDGDHAPAEKEGKVQLSAGLHPILLLFFQGGGGFEFRVRWSGPGFEMQEIPASALSHLGTMMVPVGQEKILVKPELIEAGRAAFATLGCAACHQVPGTKFEAIAHKSMASLNPANGCLSEAPGANIPRFDFSADQRTQVRAALQKVRSAPIKSPEAILTHTITALNCTSCHTRDGKGGPTEERLAYFRVNGEADMGDEGRIPPHLTKVGAKLRPEWTREILINKGFARPYMATRMPQFGEGTVGHLPALFDQVDSSSNARPEPEVSARDAKFGRRLVGVGGLTCVACHTFGDFKSQGIPAVDLTSMHKRLKFDWFYHYLIDPPSLRPGTRMPTFWPEGKAVNTEVLNGETDAQISAIWSFLAGGRQADIPPGLVQGKMEIIAETEPAIYRHFITGAGTRAIGVGYPEKVNLAWDGNEMRLALLWQGAFIDAAKHSNGRGEGFEGPLGNNIINMPEGPMFAQLENANAPWPKDTGRKAGMKLGGYEFQTASRRPAFLYSFGGISVQDFFEPSQGEIDPYFKRRLALESKDAVNNLWFRAALGQTIQQTSTDAFLVDNKIAVRLADGLVRESGGKSELIAPVRFKSGKAEILQEIIW